MELTLPAIGTPAYDQLKAKLAADVHGLRPDRRYFAGRTFFSLLLAEQDAGYYYKTLEHLRTALEKNGELEVADFEDDEVLEDLFRRSRVKLMTRRAALGVIAEGMGGAALAGYGVAGVADQLRGVLSKSEQEYPEKPSYAKALDSTVMPYAYVAIGGSMVDAAYRHAQEYKLGDIANAITRLAEKMPAAQRYDHGEGTKGLTR